MLLWQQEKAYRAVLQTSDARSNDMNGAARQCAKTLPGPSTVTINSSLRADGRPLQIRAQIGEIKSGNNGITAVATKNVLLRWLRLTGAFTLANIPSYINTLNLTLSLTPQVFTYPNATSFDE